MSSNLEVLNIARSKTYDVATNVLSCKIHMIYKFIKIASQLRIIRNITIAVYSILNIVCDLYYIIQFLCAIFIRVYYLEFSSRYIFMLIHKLQYFITINNHARHFSSSKIGLIAFVKDPVRLNIAYYIYDRLRKDSLSIRR